MAVARKTKNLQLVLEAFSTSNRALTAKAVMKTLPPTVNKTTVYRLLDRLKAGGELHSFVGEQGVMHYAKCHACTTEAHTHSHPHFQCLSCREVRCLDAELTFPELVGVQISEAQIFLKGHCQSCLPT